MLFMFHASLCYATLSVPCGLVVACWDGLASWLSCVWCFLVFVIAIPYDVPAQVCGGLYLFLIFAFFFTLNNKLFVQCICG